MPTCLLPNSTESTAWFVSTVFFRRYTRKKLTVLLDAYSGALLFVAFLSEMRQPLDFWKAVFLAQAFITVVYVFFGAFVRIISPLVPIPALTNLGLLLLRPVQLRYYHADCQAT